MSTNETLAELAARIEKTKSLLTRIDYLQKVYARVRAAIPGELAAFQAFLLALMG